MPRLTQYAIDTLLIDCPVCGKKLQVPVRATHNVLSYHEAQNVRAECCGQIVRLDTEIKMVVERASAGITEDAWGVEAEDLEP